MSKLCNNLIITLLLLGLFGCGGSDDSNDGNTPSKKVSISAQDALKFAQLNTKTTIDLRQRVQAKDNESLVLSDVKSINGDCDILSIDGLSFDIYARNANVCRFEYSVKPASNSYTGSAKAVAQIVANEDPEQGQFLPPVSRTMQKDQSVTFKLSDLVEPGYILDPNSVVALNATGTSDTGELSDISKSEFTYQAPNTETIVRIFYSAINETDNIVKPGVIYVAIGQNTNTNPVALDRTLVPIAYSDGDITIHVDDLVSDMDPDDKLQVIYAKGVLGSIKINEDLSFKYIPGGLGTEFINYIVTDHNGGYGIGMLEFDVTSYKPIIDTAQKLIFLPPMTMLSPRLSTASGRYYESGLSGIPGFYPIFEYSLAEAYCRTNAARLPSKDELQRMWASVLEEPVYTKYKWQSSLDYLTNDHSQQVSLSDGKSYSSDDLGYFTCVKSTEGLNWDFVNTHIKTELGRKVTILERYEEPLTHDVIYRNPKEYQLKAEVKKLLINGRPEDLDRVNITIKDDTIEVVNVSWASRTDSVYVDISVTDLSIPDKQVSLSIGFTVCSKGTTPEEAIKSSCVYTVASDKARFTLAIPMDMLPENYPAELHLDVFGGENGFVGTKQPNNKKWWDYIKPICDEMNLQKIDNSDRWAPGLELEPGHDSGYSTVSGTDDYTAMKQWVQFMYEQAGGSMKTAELGQGYAGLPDTQYVINQVNDSSQMAKQEQGYFDALTFASCVSPL